MLKRLALLLFASATLTACPDDQPQPLPDLCMPVDLTPPDMTGAFGDMAGAPGDMAQADGASPDMAGLTGIPIVDENQRPGDADWWVPHPQWSMGHEMEGFTEHLSYAPGEQVCVYASTAKTGDHVTWRLYRTGWYGGMGARKIADGTFVGKAQPLPGHSTWDTTARANWEISIMYGLPSDLVSGVYVFRLDNTDRNKSFLVTFVVRDDKRKAELIFQRSDFTDMAYNNWDGQDNMSSWYGQHPQWVSYHRPFISPTAYIYPYSAGYFVFEYPMVRWLEKNGFDVTYVSNFDLHVNPNALDRGTVFLSVGHDEYWSDAIRDQVEYARDAGKSLLFFASDVLDTEIRFDPGDPTQYSPTPDSNTHGKSLWVSKPVVPGGAPHENSGETLLGTHYQTWCIVPHPECGPNGLAKMIYSDPITVVASDHPVWRHVDTSSGLVGLVMGYEYEVPYAGTDKLPITPVIIGDMSKTWTDTVNPVPVVVGYQMPNGAKVFNAGSTNWGNGLDGWAGRAAFRNTGGDRPCMAGDNDCYNNTDPQIEQLTLNLLKDAGATAHTLDVALFDDAPCDWNTPEDRCKP